MRETSSIRDLDSVVLERVTGGQCLVSSSGGYGYGGYGYCQAPFGSGSGSSDGAPEAYGKTGPTIPAAPLRG